MQTFIIGRDATNQIVLNDDKVSRRHAQLTVPENGQVTIKDLGSVNGTFVNGNQVTESNLKTGDIVKCGPAFLNWAQYTNTGSPPVQQMNYQRPGSHEAFVQEPYSDLPTTLYNLGTVFKYLTTRIFDIGDLFKTNWNRTSSIIFLKGIPVILTLIISLVIYLKIPLLGFYFSPSILAILLFAVCPFFTIYLFSINKKVQIDKIALASGIIGFIQFSVLLIYAAYILIFFQRTGVDYPNIFTNRYASQKGFDLFMVFIILLAITFIINLTMAFYLFTYKYFKSIGIDRSKSIYLVVITWGTNLFFQVLSAYIVYLVVKDSIGTFNL